MDETNRLSLVNPIPSFSPPRSLIQDPPPDPTPDDDFPTDPSLHQTPREEPRRGLFGLGPRRPATPDDGTPTPTSTTSGSPSKGDVKLTGELVAAALGLAFLGAAAIVRLRKGRKLRQPTRTHLDGMGKPLGRIAARHVPVEWLNADLIDALEFGSAVAVYANEGPLTVVDRAEPNLPTNLNQES